MQISDLFFENCILIKKDQYNKIEKLVESGVDQFGFW